MKVNWGKRIVVLLVTLALVISTTGDPAYAYAYAENITSPIIVEGESRTIDGDVIVENPEGYDYFDAVSVKTDEDENGFTNASLTVNGQVKASKAPYTTAVAAFARGATTNVHVTKDVTAIGTYTAVAVDQQFGEEIEGKPNLVNLQVDGNVKAETSKTPGAWGYATCGIAVHDDGTTNTKVAGDVSAVAMADRGDAYGLYYNYANGSVEIGGNLSAEGYYASGAYIFSYQKAQIDVKKYVSAKTGNGYAEGLAVRTIWEPDADICVRVGYGLQDNAAEMGVKGPVVSAIAQPTPDESPDPWHSADAVSVQNNDGTILVDLNGDVYAYASPTGDAELENGCGIYIAGCDWEASPHATARTTVLVHGDVTANGSGIQYTAMGDPTVTDILVENAIRGKNVGVLLEKNWTYYPYPIDDPPYTTHGPEDPEEPEEPDDRNLVPKLDLTVWKIDVNARGNVAEWAKPTPIVRSHGPSADDEYDYVPALAFEKVINYIIKCEQPAKGGVIKPAYENGDLLGTSHDYPVAHQDEKVYVNVDLEPGYQIKAAYNGIGEEKTLLPKDEKGFYLTVPKGGGVSLSVELEPIQYTVTFKNYDETILQSGKFAYGVTPTYTGTTPTKPDTIDTVFTFAGWTPAIVPVTGDAVYTATYTPAARQYTVTFKNDDGTTLQSGKFAYGATPAYTGATPTKPDTADTIYTFAGWTPAIVPVTGDAVYTAVYSATSKLFTVTFKDEDGTILQSGQFALGATPAYTGATPKKAATPKYVYTFSGWTPAIVPVTGDAVYTATYSKELQEYKITFDLNGGTLGRETGRIVEYYPYGTVITMLDAPKRPGHKFLYWKGSQYDPGDSYTVTEDHVFTAEWEKDGDKKDTTPPIEPTPPPTEPTPPPTTPTPPATPPTAPTAPGSSGGTLDNSPQTGDSSNPGLWLALSAVSLAGLLAILLQKKRSSQR